MWQLLQIGDTLQTFDEYVLKCFEESTSIELSPSAKEQAQLSAANGGLGLRSLNLHSPAAFISSVALSGAEWDISSSIDLYNNRVKETSKLHFSTESQIPGKWKSQKRLSEEIEKQLLRQLLESTSSQSDRARLLEVSSRSVNASKWITAVPSPGLGNKFEPDEAQVLFKHRLGLPLASPGKTCTMCPDKALDPHGHHALTCKKGPDVVSRHNFLRNTIFNYARNAQMSPVLEQGANLDQAGTLTRPADVLIPLWSLGKAGAIDVTVAHPLNPLTIEGASATPGYCLEVAETRKHAANEAKCRDLGWKCLAVAFTPYGTIGEEGKLVLKRIASRLAIQNRCKPSSAHNELVTRVGVILARCTARAILARTPRCSVELVCS